METPSPCKRSPTIREGGGGGGGGEDNGSLYSALYVYNHLMAACVGASKWHRAIAFYQDMVENEVIPDDITITALIQAHAMLRNKPEMGELLVNMTRKGWYVPSHILPQTVHAACVVVDSGKTTSQLKEAIRNWKSNSSTDASYRKELVKLLAKETNNSVVVSEEEEQFISTDDDDSVGGSSNHDTDNGVPFAERLTKEEMEMAEKQKGLFDRMNIQIHDNNNDNEVKEEKSHDSSNNNNNNNNKQSAVEDNPNPEIFQSFRYKYKEAQRRMTKNGNSIKHVYELIANITDPEHPLTLQQLGVVHPDLIELHTDVTNGLDRLTVKVRPTVPHCSVASLIGLCIHLTLSRYLDIDRVKLSVRMAEGSHNQEEDVNAQLADKERVSAALENKALLERLETMMILCGTKS